MATEAPQKYSPREMHAISLALVFSLQQNDAVTLEIFKSPETFRAALTAAKKMTRDISEICGRMEYALPQSSTSSAAEDATSASTFADTSATAAFSLPPVRRVGSEGADSPEVGSAAVSPDAAFLKNNLLRCPTCGLLLDEDDDNVCNGCGKSFCNECRCLNCDSTAV